MTNTTAGLIALVILAALVVALFILCRASESGHGSRFKDLDEGLKRLKEADSWTAKFFVIFYFGRILVRIGQWGFAAAAIAALASMAAAIFGGGWEIARQMLCDVLRFLETMLKGAATSCPPPAPAPAVSAGQ
jgi:hypothetical protein